MQTTLNLSDGRFHRKLDPLVSCKVLNLYAGLGGNRELWENCDVTSVEYDDAIAEVYATKFPQDEIVVGDALEYVQSHFKGFDFIWASPPCPTHGQYRRNVGVIGKGFAPVIPEMTSLYGLIVFLQTYFAGTWVVENVKPYYSPLIQPTFELHRHLFWANFHAGPREFKKAEIRKKNKISDFDGADLVKASRITNKRQALRNCVDAQLGLHIFNAANAQIGRGTPSAESDCSTLTRCEICKEDCGTFAGLIVHVRKFHPSSDNESTRKGLT